MLPSSESYKQFLGKLLIVLAVGIGLFLAYQLRYIILMLFGIVIIAYTILPFVEFFERYNIPRVITTAGVVFITSGALVGLVFAIYSALQAEYQELAFSIADNYNDLRERFQLDQLIGSISPQDLVSQVSGLLQGGAFSTGLEGLVAVGSTLFGALFTAITAVTILFYLVYDPNRISSFLITVLPKTYQKKATTVLDSIQAQLSKWLQGQFLLMLSMGVLSYIGFLIIGVPYPFVLASLVGILDIIPVVGPLIALIPILLVTVLDSPVKAIFVLILFVILQVAEGNVLVPKIMSRTVGLDPLYVIIALLVGSSLAGTVGAILAIPGSVIVKIIYEEIQKYRESGQLDKFKE